MSTLRERMQELVHETGWTVGEISGKARVSSSAVSQWLSGETLSLRIEPAVLLERLTGFSALWLAKGKGQKKVDGWEAPADDKSKGLGKMIRVLRKQAGMTQAELASAVGMERTSITNIETGKQTLTVRSINALADALGHTVHVTFRRKR